MSRINSNLASMQAIHRLSKNQSDLSTRLQRLSSGLKINSGKDAPAGLIASETLRSEMAGINQAIDNSQRAGNVMNTAEAALSEVSSLLLEVQTLTNQAANVGALSPDEIKANQLQVDAILNSVNRIANTTQFNGVKLLNGSLDYTTSSVDTTFIPTLTVNSASLVDNGAMTVTVEMTQSAQYGQVKFTGSGLAAANNVTLEISGNGGTRQISFAGSASVANMAAAIVSIKEATGVSATTSGTGALYFQSTGYGEDNYVSVNVISGTFATDALQDYGRDAAVTVNGAEASASGLNITFRSASLDLEMELDPTNFNTLGTQTFGITGGGAKFQLGSEVNAQGQAQVGIQSVATTKLGNRIDGFLSTLESGGANTLVGGNTIAAQKIINAAIRQVANLRGRLGAFQKDTLETNINSLSVALENVTASESAIRDADFATETAAMTRAQILVQATTSVLAQANSSPQNVLTLLGR